MALPSPACGGSLPAPATAAALQPERPEGREVAGGEQRSAPKRSARSCRGRSHLPSASGDAAVTPCLCSASHRDVFAAPRGQHPCSQPCQQDRIHSCSWRWEGEGSEAAARPVQQPLAEPVSPPWGQCGSPGPGTVPSSLLHPSGGCLRSPGMALAQAGCAKGWGVLWQPGGSICLWVSLSVCRDVSRVPLLPAGRAAPCAGTGAVQRPQEPRAPGKGRVLERSWMSGEGTVPEGLWVPGDSAMVVDSVGFIRFSCRGAAQTQQVRAGPTPGTQGRVWMDTPVGRGTFQLPQPCPCPAWDGASPSPAACLALVTPPARLQLSELG